MLRKIDNLRIILLDLPKSSKLIISLLIDSLLCIFTIWISFYLRLGELFPFGNPILMPSLISIIFAIPVFYLSGLYRTIFRYSGWPAMLTVSKSIFFYGIVFFIFISIITLKDVPRTIGIIQPLLLFFAVGGSRALVRFWIGDLYQDRLKKSALPKAVIYGAGNSGRKLLIALENNKELEISCFLDDDVEKQGRVLSGKRIFPPDYLDKLVSQQRISYLLLALPKITRFQRKEIINKVIKYNLSVRILPSFVDLAKGKKGLSDLNELEIEDLLGREKVAPKKNLMIKNIKSKIVLVTGAGGSIGSQICREVIRIGPEKLLLLDSNEYALYSILNEISLVKNKTKVEIIPLLSSVQDREKINEILYNWKPDTVYHAAAYKHVPLVEHNLAEGVKNNVFGTLELALACLRTGVSDFVFISTDKAVRPTNIMGATKRLGEICLQSLFANKKEHEITKFSMVRFGNVLDSSGSVIPKFRKQIKERVPITLTDPKITRFFMTIKEASELVIQAGAMAKGGEVFLLDMGEPIKIYDLAKKMIQLSGLKLRDENNIKGDIDILITGLRPGEKLYEELLIDNKSKSTIHPLIYKAEEKYINHENLMPIIEEMETALINQDLYKSLSLLKQIVPEWERSA